MKDLEVPVLIVGGGGCGLSLSIFLSHVGVPSLLVERNAGTTQLPRAHILNQRTMEIFSQHGLAEEVYRQGTPAPLMERISFRTSLGGDGPLDRRLIANLDGYGGGALRERYEADGAYRATNLPLMQLEPLLRGVAEGERDATVRFAHELERFEQDDSGVSATIRDQRAGSEYTVHARYMVAADGGKTVGRMLNAEMSGPRRLRKMVNTYFAADLSRWIDDDGVLLFYFMNPDGRGAWASGGLVKTGPKRWDRHSETWVFMRELAPDDPEVLDEPSLIQKIRDLLGLPELGVRVLGIGRWDVEGVAAKRYGFGRIFLAGDAAHRHPPVSALGLNTAIADSHNLAWKLALVLAGRADDRLLDTYEAERQPVGARVAEWALNGFRLRGLIDQAIGLVPAQTDANRRAFERLYADTPAGATARAILAEVMRTQRIGPQAHDMEIGYAYEAGALVPDGTPPPPRDPMAGLYYPTTRPGARLPHAFLTREGRHLSTHDLVRPGRFSLFCSNGAWVEACAAASRRLGVPIDPILISTGGRYADADGTWSRVRQIDDAGAVLVRPDAHVAWRAGEAGRDSAAALHAALELILARSR